MRSKNSELMERIVRFVGDYYRLHFSSPTVRTIAEELEISKSTAHSYLVEMNKRGILSYENGIVSDLPQIAKTKTGYFSAPLVGSIRCGDPETEEQEVEMYICLPQAVFGRGEFYLLRAVGDSMEDAGISDGDLVLIKKQTYCEIGDIVVALNEESENTLKKYDGIDEDSNKAVLRYANESVYPGKKILFSKLVVQGVAKHMIKEL